MRFKKEKKLNAIVSALLEWYLQNARDLPWRRTGDPYAIWVSEIMLQQTQVSTVIPYWERWMRELPDIRSLARASEQRVLKLWEGLGYYTRARNLHRAAQSLNGRAFPREFEDVLALPGIGRYTAGAICSIAFNQPTPVLDGNVRRVLSRLFATHHDLWEFAQRLVLIAHRSADRLSTRAKNTGGQPFRAPTRLCGNLNQALMELGAVVCTPCEPHCAECPIGSHCGARKLERIDQFPPKAKRVEVTHRRFAVFVYRHRGRYLVRQRPGNVVNGRLWEFPNVELPNGVAPKGTRLCAFQHTITRYRNAVDAFLIQEKAQIDGKWLPLARLDRLPFSSAHRKILVALRARNAV